MRNCSHSFFERLVLHTRKNQGLFGKGLTAKVIPSRSVTHMCLLPFLTPVLTQLFFTKPPTTFLTCFCRGERQNMLERKSASTRSQTHNHQAMSPTRSPLSHPYRANLLFGKYISFTKGKTKTRKKKLMYVLIHAIIFTINIPLSFYVSEN